MWNVVQDSLVNVTSLPSILKDCHCLAKGSQKRHEFSKSHFSAWSWSRIIQRKTFAKRFARWDKRRGVFLQRQLQMWAHVRLLAALGVEFLAYPLWIDHQGCGFGHRISCPAKIQEKTEETRILLVVEEVDNLGRIPEKKVQSTKPRINISLAVNYCPFPISKHSRRQTHLTAYRHFITMLCSKHPGFG